MPRLKITLPNSAIFNTVLQVRITDINYGHHLANDKVLGLVHEARLRCLQKFGFDEVNLGQNNIGLVVGDAAIVYKSQGRWYDYLEVAVSVGDFHTYGCDFYYLLKNQKSQTEVARAKTAILAFDYKQQKLAILPDKFKQALQQAEVAQA
ncbi:MAG: thioesterase family protein [Pseudomonadota bacterium]